MPIVHLLKIEDIALNSPMRFDIGLMRKAAENGVVLWQFSRHMNCYAVITITRLLEKVRSNCLAYMTIHICLKIFLWNAPFPTLSLGERIALSVRRHPFANWTASIVFLQSLFRRISNPIVFKTSVTRWTWLKCRYINAAVAMLHLNVF